MNGIIHSPDTKRARRIPPGQRLEEDWPILHHGATQAVDPATWTLRLFGLVDEERAIGFEEFKSFPQVTVHADTHCVTGWTVLDTIWTGVQTTFIETLVTVSPDAFFVMVHAAGGYTTNLTREDFFQPDVLFATHRDGNPIPPEEGAPVRLVVPRLYFWKSAKWVTGIEFRARDRRGFWESRGYHNRGDPWNEERYG